MTRKVAAAPGPELHAWGDMTPVGRDVSGFEKYPVEEGPKYRNRRGEDKIHPEQLGRDMSDMQGATVDYADVGELIGLTDLLHQAAATQEKTMTPEDFLKMIGEEAGLAADEPGGDKGKREGRQRTGAVEPGFNWAPGMTEEQQGRPLTEDEARGLARKHRNEDWDLMDLPDLEGWLRDEVDPDIQVQGAVMARRQRTAAGPNDPTPGCESCKQPALDEDGYVDRPGQQCEQCYRRAGAEYRRSKGIAPVETDLPYLKPASRRTAAGTQPSRELTNVPAVVINETRIRLENRDDWLKEHDAELDPEDQSAFNLLEEESERRGIGASRRTAGEMPPQFTKKPSRDGVDMNARDDLSPIDSADHGVDQGAEIAENDALSRIEDALETLEAHDLDPDAQQGVDEIGDAVEELQDLQAGEDDADDDREADGDSDSPDEDGDNDDEKKNPFAKASAHQWGRRIEAAIRLDNAPRPRFEPDFVIGAEKTAAADLEFDIFGGDSSDFYTSAEHSIAGMAVNRFTERRGRFVPPSPQLINACAIVLRKTLGKIKASYSVDHYDLSKFASHTINPVDGSTLNGEITWHAILSNHARGRRGSVDLVLQIVGGAPAAMVEVLAGNQRIPFTRQAIDRHLNIRRDRTRGFHHNSPVEVAVISE